MPDAGSDPVSFENPPVNEVILSVQLESSVVDEVGVLADYWPSIRHAFPGHLKQPPLPPMREDFSAPDGQSQINPFEFISGTPPIRYWFLSLDETRLVQVQPDRFTYNWRQVPGHEEYPRYRELRPEFAERYTKFLESAVADQAEVLPSWCEITYINHVEAGTGHDDGAHGPLSRILRALNPSATCPSLPATEDTQFQQRFRILDEAAERPIGRFYITAVPAFRAADAAPIYVITLIARGLPADKSTNGVLAFFDRGRDLIVNGFKELTTAEMHQRWGLQP